MQHKIIGALCLTLLASVRAQAVGRMADVTLIDRDSGAVLTPYYYRGEYWVAGTPGARYAIHIRNRGGERLLAVTSVDGLNVLTGAQAGFDQAGYVFRPAEEYEITGWRKSDAEIAAFTFTDPSGSYAARTGRPANIGVIGVALFRERAYEPPLIGGVSPPPRALAQNEQAQNAPPAAAGNTLGERRAAPSLDASRESLAQLAPPRLPLSPSLGTGHGEREYSYVSHTEFTRLTASPEEIIRIRYDRLDNLIAMGIVRRPRPVLPELNPFPGSQPAYVPDPPG
ncbi:MAG TPA: hypothetical protein VKT22_00980 [Steroidobacteraceae bacterium]|nr:hypothetical protein [Steroidobacteraceae bacterium]